MKALLLLLLTLATHAPALAADTESYSVRPDILSIKPQAHPNLTSGWENLKRGHLEAVALLIEMYPTHEIYFLARDSEYLFDTARLLTQGEPAIQSRLHLLNISRANMNAEHVVDYLAQEGISEKTLSEGKQVLFVDTGFSGTISSAVQEKFPAHLASQIQTHLVCSANSEHPSMRVFLATINPAAPTIHPGTMHGTIISYEHLPHYTDRSDRFQKVDDKWQPLSPLHTEEDGEVSPEKAITFMEDLAFETNQPESRSLFENRRKQWRELKQASESELFSLLEKMLGEPVHGAFLPANEALVRDYLNLADTGHVQLTAPTAESLGLAAIQNEGKKGSNKNFLIKKYPAWKAILQDPETQIQILLTKEDFGTLGAIVDTIQDEEFIQLLCRALSKQPLTKNVETFLRMLIEKGTLSILGALAEHTFTYASTGSWTAPLQLLIEKLPADRLDLLIKAFSQPHADKWDEALLLITQKADPKILNLYISWVFVKHEGPGLEKTVAYLVENGDSGALTTLSDRVFRLPKAKNWVHHFERVIEKEIASAKSTQGNSQDGLTLSRFLFSPFNSNHGPEWMLLLRRLIEVSNRETLNELGRTLGDLPQFPGYADIIDLIIQKSDQTSLQAWAHRMCWSPRPESLRLLIEKGDQAVLLELTRSLSLVPAIKGAEWDQTFERILEKGDVAVLNILLESPFFQTPSPSRAHLKQRLLSRLQSFHFSLVSISPALKAGDHFQTPSGKAYEVKSFIDKGKRGRVYQVIDTHGRSFALKVAKDDRPETLQSFAKEGAKTARYHKLGVRYAYIVEEGVADPSTGASAFVLKNWIEGTRADVWLREWAERESKDKTDSIGEPPMQLQKLKTLIKIVSDKGAYIGDLNPKNLIWHPVEDNWYIVDSGGIEEGLSSKVALSRFLEKLPARWAKAVQGSTDKQKTVCNTLLGSLKN